MASPDAYDRTGSNPWSDRAAGILPIAEVVHVPAIEKIEVVDRHLSMRLERMIHNLNAWA